MDERTFPTTPIEGLGLLNIKSKVSTTCFGVLTKYPIKVVASAENATPSTAGRVEEWTKRESEIGSHCRLLLSISLHTNWERNVE